MYLGMALCTQYNTFQTTTTAKLTISKPLSLDINISEQFSDSVQWLCHCLLLFLLNEWQVYALANHTTAALYLTQQTIRVINQELEQTQKNCTTKFHGIRHIWA